MKKSGNFLFETQLKWQHDKKGILTSREITDTIKVATPWMFKDFGAGLWSPEHLLIGALSSCFMTTYMFYAKEKGLTVLNFDCEVIGLVELKNDKLKLTEINVYPTITVENSTLLDIAKEVIEITKINCLVAKALNVTIYYHPSLEITVPPLEKKEQQFAKKERSSLNQIKNHET